MSKQLQVASQMAWLAQLQALMGASVPQRQTPLSSSSCTVSSLVFRTAITIFLVMLLQAGLVKAAASVSLISFKLKPPSVYLHDTHA